MAIYEVTLIHPRDPGKRTQYVQRYLVESVVPYEEVIV